MDEEEKKLLMEFAAQVFPLSKRELFAAFSLMGLTSRLQPRGVSNAADRALVVDLAFEMADIALAKSKQSTP